MGLRFFIAAIVSIWAFSPLRQAQFTGDDWHYLVLLANIDSWRPIFTDNLVLSYLYRPIALTLFAASVNVFDADPFPHYGINVILHGLTAICLWHLACAGRMENTRSNAFRLFFFVALLCPISAATVFWISNRFDLCATLFSLGTIAGIVNWSRRESASKALAPLSLLSLAMALGCKETAFACVPAVLLVLAFAPGQSPSARRTVAFAVLATTVAWLIARRAALGGWEGDTTLPLNFGVLLKGLTNWVVGFASFSLGEKFWLVASATLTIATLIQIRIRPDRRCWLTLLAILTFGVGTVILQSPIMAHALDSVGDTMPTVSYRFYYAPIMCAIAIAGLLIACNPAPQAGGLRRVGVVATALLLLAWSAQLIHGKATEWSKQTTNEVVKFAALRPTIDQKILLANPSPRCLVDLGRLPQNVVGLPIDLMYKAGRLRGDPALLCVLASVPPQAMSITAGDSCSYGATPGWRSEVASIQPAPRAGTCTFFFLKRVELQP